MGEEKEISGKPLKGQKEFEMREIEDCNSNLQRRHEKRLLEPGAGGAGRGHYFWNRKINFVDHASCMGLGWPGHGHIYLHFLTHQDSGFPPFCWC